MKYQDEKKLVADFLDYELIDSLHVKNKSGDWVVDGKEWNPWSKREWWGVIFFHIRSEELILKFLNSIQRLIPPMGCECEKLTARQDLLWALITVPTEILWKALIKTLENSRSS